MRGQLHRVDDFAGQWTKEAEALEGSPMKLSLLRELDGVRRCAHFAVLCKLACLKEGSAWRVVQPWHFCCYGLQHLVL